MISGFQTEVPGRWGAGVSISVPRVGTFAGLGTAVGVGVAVGAGSGVGSDAQARDIIAKNKVKARTALTIGHLLLDTSCASGAGNYERSGKGRKHDVDLTPASLIVSTGHLTFVL